MRDSTSKQLKVGILGCGAIAQAAHFESATKARNAELYAVCDVAEDLARRMAITHGAQKTFADYEKMLADPELDAVVIATSEPRGSPSNPAFGRARAVRPSDRARRLPKKRAPTPRT